MENALQESEKRFRLLYEQAPLGYQSLDEDGCLIEVNRAWLDLLGYARKEEVLGRWFGSFLTDECQALFRERFPRFKAAGETHGVQFDMLRKDGARIVCSIDGQIARDADGHFERTHCIMHDITAVKQAEHIQQQAYADMEEKVEQRTATLKAINWELRQEISQRVAAEEALRSEKEQAQQRLNELAHAGRLATMGEMVSGLAHELNQPLAAIANYAHVCLHCVRGLRGENLDDVRDAIQQIAEQAQRAGGIIRHLRESVRRGESDRSTAELNDLVRGVAVLLEVEARLHGVRLDLALGDALPQVVVDRIQIEQVITNLVKNAMEATRGMSDGPRLVTICTSRGKAGTVELAVIDTGCGIPPAEAGRLFEPFFTTKPTGMGLGLSISRSIVESHGGRLEAAHNPDRGMRFRFSLPAHGPDQPQPI
jgi:PAS domain S-box-containing protein